MQVARLIQILRMEHNHGLSVNILLFKVLVWKTNFDQIDYNEVLQSHQARLRGEAAPPTVQHIPPRSPHTSSAKSPSRVCILNKNLFLFEYLLLACIPAVIHLKPVMVHLCW